MEEDVLGPRKTVIGQNYDNCTRCGQPVLRTQASIMRVPGEGPSVVSRDTGGSGAPERLHPPQATQDGPPPVLCPDCARDITAGETLERPT
jgi:hypothetical protein